MRLADRIKIWLYFKILNASASLISKEFAKIKTEIETDLGRRTEKA